MLPLFPILINSMVEYCIDCLVEVDAINTGPATVPHLSFSDDIVVVSDIIEELQRQVNVLTSRFNQCYQNFVVNQKRVMWAIFP